MLIFFSEVLHMSPLPKKVPGIKAIVLLISYSVWKSTDLYDKCTTTETVVSTLYTKLVTFWKTCQIATIFSQKTHQYKRVSWQRYQAHIYHCSSCMAGLRRQNHEKSLFFLNISLFTLKLLSYCIVIVRLCILNSSLMDKTMF